MLDGSGFGQQHPSGVPDETPSQRFQRLQAANSILLKISFAVLFLHTIGLQTLKDAASSALGIVGVLIAALVTKALLKPVPSGPHPTKRQLSKQYLGDLEQKHGWVKLWLIISACLGTLALVLHL